LSNTSLPFVAEPPAAAFFAGDFAGGLCANTAPATAIAAIPRIIEVRFTIPPETLVKDQLPLSMFDPAISTRTRHKGQVPPAHERDFRTFDAPKTVC
jgi:hypothetical protein